MRNSHRSYLLDRYLNKRVEITRQDGIYIGYLQYDDGWYYMNDYYYLKKTDDGYEKPIIKDRWVFRKTTVSRAKDIRTISDSAVVDMRGAE